MLGCLDETTRRKRVIAGLTIAIPIAMCNLTKVAAKLVGTQTALVAYSALTVLCGAGTPIALLMFNIKLNRALLKLIGLEQKVCTVDVIPIKQTN